jgi:hypothetical protein
MIQALAALARTESLKAGSWRSNIQHAAPSSAKPMPSGW